MVRIMGIRQGETTLSFVKSSIESVDSKALLQELNEVLIGTLGHDGTLHVCPEDFGQNKAFFLVGYECGAPVCCAGVRVLDDETGEVKRVYARTRSRGVGAALMAAVEDEARALGYRRLVLECRGGNPRAIAFYLRNGYSVCPNYPPYNVESDAVCMEKYL